MIGVATGLLLSAAFIRKPIGTGTIVTLGAGIGSGYAYYLAEQRFKLMDKGVDSDQLYESHSILEYNLLNRD
eukprot:CAMPEP_0116874568 /NCGR_PEP_ID=MMETSP0463-20121206/6040_1 /TAXON_ID=181622 /ORGANISM="Strombidinopsis sp, Strain SopsisLIS2011" /LENGTH=71 /DNA_ID=CAMNT_0004518363 /DNA_START=77 /DNA_END=292 /DNA_ORIENTATION=+